MFICLYSFYVHRSSKNDKYIKEKQESTSSGDVADIVILRACVRGWWPERSCRDKNFLLLFMPICATWRRASSP